jgi:MtN3 and saliva related transmembrane protein
MNALIIAEMVGYIASMCTVGSFIPQVLQTYKTRSVKDISVLMYFILSFSAACWTIYGVLLGAIPIIVSNILVLTMALMILAMKLRWDKINPDKLTHPS